MNLGSINLGNTIIKGRRSIRKYKEDPVPEEAIKDALDCAHQAPTARNAQPWLFGVVKDPEMLKKIADITSHGKFIAGASVCFAVFGEKDHKFYVEDCSAATDHLMLGLWAHGVGSCWVAGHNMDYAEAINELMNIPDTHTLVSLIPAGYPADVKVPLKKKLDDIVFYEQYGKKN